MLENEILKLLRRISSQLEEIAQTQGTIKAEIGLLHSELLSFQQYTQELENRISKSEVGLLN